MVSGDDGTFRITGLASGTYVVSSTRIGFEAKRADGIAVAESGTITVNFALTEISTTLKSGRHHRHARRQAREDSRHAGVDLGRELGTDHERSGADHR